MKEIMENNEFFGIQAINKEKANVFASFVFRHLGITPFVIDSKVFFPKEYKKRIKLFLQENI